MFQAGVPQNIGINVFGNKSCDVEIGLYDSRKTGIQSKVDGHFEPNKPGVLELQVSPWLMLTFFKLLVCL